MKITISIDADNSVDAAAACRAAANKIGSLKNTFDLFAGTSIPLIVGGRPDKRRDTRDAKTVGAIRFRP